MIEDFFRGDTFGESFKFGFDLQVGDKIHYAVLKEFEENYVYDNEIIIDSPTDNVYIEIASEYTKDFPIGYLTLEVELTYNVDKVKTHQYKFECKKDGIHGRN